MKTKKFKELFKYLPKSNLSAGQGNDIGNFVLYTSSTKASKKIDKAQFFQEAIIFGNGGSANIHYANKPFSTTSHCFVAVPIDNNINIKSVYYYLSGNLHLLERGFKGAGLKNISPKYIEEIDIPIFSIETQNKIVSVLDKASSLIQKRNESISNLDKLINATFLEMFGHLINNKSIEPQYLQDHVAENDKINYGVVQPGDEFLGGVPIIRVGDFNDSYIEPSGLKRIDPAINDKHKNSILQGGEILIVCVGATIGKVALIEESFKGYNIVRATARVKCGATLKNTYLLSLLLTDFYQHKLKSLSKTVAQPTLNIKQIEELQIPVPSIEKQIEYDKFYNRAVENKKKAKISLINIKNLFFSISQRVFNEQLNFNVDLELDALINEIDLQKKNNDVKEISGDIAYLQRLIDKLNTQDFERIEMYNKAKIVAFQLMNENENTRKVTQEYDEKTESIKLSLI
jgi:type I restriction enzyme, S subunit